MAKADDIFEQIVKAYKLFRTKPGEPETLYPLFVNANKPVPMNEWVRAEVGPLSTTGKVKSKLGELAYRPGWHAGDLPVATHIGEKSRPGLRAPDVRPPNQVWAEVDMPADVDWQAIANQRALLNKQGEIIPRTAHITNEIPFGGHYRYKTSPNMQGNWLISGDMRVNRVLSDDEVRAINEAFGVFDLPRYSPLKRAEGGLACLAGGGKSAPLRYAASWLMKERVPDDLGVLKFRHPVKLADEARLSGFTTPEQNVFHGYTKTGQEFTVPREYVNPETILKSRDKNKTAEFLRESLSDYIKPGFASGGHTTPAWQRKEGQNPEGGLNAAGRASYKAETGGTLKRPQPEGGARKKSFCARMTGMKKKLTSSKTANDPDSRINKSLRKWKC